MLRRIRLKNFVHFDEEQDITFREGSSFCIGQNGSGKSSLFEGVRRCMSTSKNLEISANYDSSRPSIVMCYLEFHDTDIPMDGQTKPLKGIVISAVVYLPTSEDVRIKFVFVEDWKEIFVDIYRISREGFVVNEMVTLDRNMKDNLTSILPCETVDLDNIFRPLKDVTRGRSGGTEYTEYTDCEQFLQTFVDKTVVITSPMRSIAAFQWTNSKKLIPGNRLLARTEVQERAEILAWYFDPKNDALQYDKLVKRFFAIITDNCTVTFFRQSDGKIFAHERQATKSILGIEKIPEGYFEAMNCAIILAYPGFKTVCLEEPGRGMHPQMVERLRDLILKSIEDKIVLVTSHKPAFVNSWNFPRMLFFKKIRVGNDPVKLKIIPGESLTGERSNMVEGIKARSDSNLQKGLEKTMRITTTRHFTTLYFARRVLLVEGNGDLLFLSEMKSILLVHDTLVTEAIKSALEQKQELLPITADLVEDFRRFLWPLHILGLNGEPNKSKLEQVCNTLEIERYFVLDYDAITDDQQTNPEVPTFDRFLQEFNLTDTNISKELCKDTEKEIRDSVVCLENVGLFVWKPKRVQKPQKKAKFRGTIEIALKDLCQRSSSKLKDVLDSNKVRLQWNDKKDEKHRHKLFVHKELTDDNIEVVVREVMMNCQKNVFLPNEFFRLVVFLCKMFLKQRPNQGPETVYSRQSTSS